MIFLSNLGSFNLKKLEAFIFDLDGCIYIGNRAIPGANNLVKRLKELDKKVLFVTNNATKKPEEFVSKLRSFGIKASVSDILTSGTATAMYLFQEFGKCKVFPVGGAALKAELQKWGHHVVSMNHIDKADFVVACLDFQFSYRKLCAASKAIRSGKRFIATNTDPVIPTEDGFIPGAGAIVSAIVTATNVEPHIIGKPSRHILDMAFKKLNVSPEETAILGDRLDTDIKGGNEVGAFTILVLSGATSIDKANSISDPKLVPKLTLPDVGHMLSYL